MRNMKGVAAALVLSAAICRPGFAQTAPGGGIGPSGGEVAGGIAVVAAGAVGITYLALHNRGTVVGCVQSDGNGTSSLIDQNKKVYVLVANASPAVPPGERVKLKGKKGKNGSRDLTFQVRYIVKDFGPCPAVTASTAGSASGTAAR